MVNFIIKSLSQNQYILLFLIYMEFWNENHVSSTLVYTDQFYSVFTGETPEWFLVPYDLNENNDNGLLDFVWEELDDDDELDWIEIL